VNVRRLTDWLVAALVAELSFAAFFPALRADFVSWDDPVNFLNNPFYRGLGWSQLTWMWTVLGGHYMPLTWMTLGLDYTLWGMTPGGYHLTNLILHTLGAVAAYFVALRVLAAAVASEPRALLRLTAAVAALLFAIHPLRVESVAWVTERRDVLSGLFFLLAIACWLRALEGGPKARRWYWTSVSVFALALLSKAIAVTLPVVLLVLDVYPLRRLGPGRWTGPAARRVWLDKAPYVALSAGAAVMAVVAQRSAGALSELGVVGWPERLGLSFYGLAFYAWKTLWPTRLSPLYEAPYDYGTLTAWFFWSAAVVLAAAGALALGRRRAPGAAAAGVVFVVLLGPVLGLLHFGPHIVADRNTYLAGLAPAFLAAGLLLRAWHTRREPLRRAATGVTVVALAALLLLTWRQTKVWQDSETLWNHALRVNPSSLAHSKVGAILDEAGRSEAALGHFAEAIRLHPDNAWAYNGWGIALGNLGRLPESIEKFQAALTLRPTYGEARHNLDQARARATNPVVYGEFERARRGARLRASPQ
jgi:tetratricopeptide (TPR) repeat protein